ncbi:MAG: DUF1579 domain-containing protein [Bacteroidota bacterium]|nr:DUF1579 domain-containing protein [Bacteroidota bacterium]
MKNFLYLLLFVTIFITIPVINAQEQKDNMTKEQKEAQKIWMEYMTPGWAHKILSNSVGDWKVKMTSWMDPSMGATQAEGNASAEMVLGGRYVQMKFHGNFMGMPYEGFSTDAYDNAKNVFINTWIDNMGTGLMYSEGKYDAATKTINYEGKMFNPVTKADEKYRETVNFADKDKIIMEMFNIKNNEEYKSLHVEYTR